MNRKQISLLDMYGHVLAQMNAEALPTDIAGISALKEELETLVNSIREHKPMQETRTPKLTEQKNSILSELRSECSQLMDFLNIIAKATPNDELQLLLVNKSELNSMREDEVLTFASSLVQALETYAASLTEVGYPATRAEALKVHTSKFAELRSKPREVIKTRKIATAVIEQLFEEANLLLKEHIDVLVKAYEDQHPEWALKYFTAREAVDPATRPRDVQETEVVQDSQEMQDTSQEAKTPTSENDSNAEESPSDQPFPPTSGEEDSSGSPPGTA